MTMRDFGIDLPGSGGFDLGSGWRGGFDTTSVIGSGGGDIGSYVNDLIGGLDSDPAFNFDLSEFTAGDDANTWLDDVYNTIDLGDSGDSNWEYETGRTFSDTRLGQYDFDATDDGISPSDASDYRSLEAGTGAPLSSDELRNHPKTGWDAVPVSTSSRDGDSGESWIKNMLNGISSDPRVQSSIITGMFQAGGGLFTGIAKSYADKKAQDAAIKAKRDQWKREDEKDELNYKRASEREDKSYQLALARDELNYKRQLERDKIQNDYVLAQIAARGASSGGSYSNSNNSTNSGGVATNYEFTDANLGLIRGRG